MRATFLATLLALASPTHRVDSVVPSGSAVVAQDGPGLFESLLARYDALADGPAKDALERRIDDVAGQRYATVSRLYWHQDFASAQAAAHTSGRPILSLRLLGRLDEDESCANSRFFRVVLYANEELSGFLRENFVLHWSSERPVPKVTIDFGDGRTLRTTITGNSVHFVLDADGRPIDALPGLYDPVTFRAALEEALPLARESVDLDPTARAQGIADHQRASRIRSAKRWKVVGDSGVVLERPRNELVAAQFLTVGKLLPERPIATALTVHPPADPTGIVPMLRLADARLDARSRELVRRLRPVDGSEVPNALAGEALDDQIARFEEAVVLDTRDNELNLRPMIARWIGNPAAPTFDALIELVYRDVFLTPRGDPWLGLVPQGVFNALPDGGLSR